MTSTSPICCGVSQKKVFTVPQGGLVSTKPAARSNTADGLDDIGGLTGKRDRGVEKEKEKKNNREQLWRLEERADLGGFRGKQNAGMVCVENLNF
jgi:hypothetical protein